MNTHPKNALKVLQLLLRCGMVCREELNVVLEMIPAVPEGRLGAMDERAGTVTQYGETGALQSRQKTLTIEFDNRV